ERGREGRHRDRDRQRAGDQPALALLALGGAFGLALLAALACLGRFGGATALASRVGAPGRGPAAAPGPTAAGAPASGRGRRPDGRGQRIGLIGLEIGLVLVLVLVLVLGGRFLGGGLERRQRGGERLDPFDVGGRLGENLRLVVGVGELVLLIEVGLLLVVL